MSELDEIVEVLITATSANISQRGFGTPCVVGYHTAWLERSRAYTDVGDIADDGIDTASPIYLAAREIFAQKPRPPSIKVGRREGAPTQSLRFTPGTPVATEVFSLTVGGVTFSVTADGSPSIAEICASFTRLINADDDAVVASGVGSTGGIQTITTGFNGVLGSTLAPPRNLTLTFNAHADWDASTIVVTGTDKFGRVQTESFLVPNGGGATVTGTKVFASVTSLSIPAQSGTNGTLKVGVGVLFANEDLDVTATDGTTHFDVVADVAGDWFAYSEVTANLSLEDRTAEPGTTLADDLDEIVAADPDFYGICVADAQSKAQILAVAAWTESNERLYIALSLDTAVGTTSTTDVGSATRDASYTRTHVQFQGDGDGPFPDAGLLGRMLPTKPGSATWEYKTLAGVSVDDPSATAKMNFTDKNVGWYENIGGVNVTRGAKVASGEWIDVIVFIDWLTARIQERVAAFFVARDKVPYTDASVEAIKGEVNAVLVLGIAAGGLAADPAPVVTAPKVADVDTLDRQNRLLPDVRFDGRLAGAIHKTQIRGTVSV